MKYKIVVEDYREFKGYYIYYRSLLRWYPVMNWMAGHPKAFETEKKARTYARNNFNKPLEKQY